MNTGGYIACVAKAPKHPKVAAWVRAIMRASGERSQEAIAERLGISRSGFAKWFYGNQEPSLAELQKLEALAAKVGVPPYKDYDPEAPLPLKTNGANRADLELESAMTMIRAALVAIADPALRVKAAIRALAAIEERAVASPESPPGAASQSAAGRHGSGRQQAGSPR